ncbi:hypothetical protein HQ535_10845 [bacterium]|nr:hypothetical protein [bacterium]
MNETMVVPFDERDRKAVDFRRQLEVFEADLAAIERVGGRVEIERMRHRMAYDSLLSENAALRERVSGHSSWLEEAVDHERARHRAAFEASLRESAALRDAMRRAVAQERATIKRLRTLRGALGYQLKRAAPKRVVRGVRRRLRKRGGR